MADLALKAENIGKRYTLRHQLHGGYKTLRDEIANSVSSLTRSLSARLTGQGPSEPSREEFWALRGVSFEVQRGQVLGIIGRNGAGKSTLLKLISRISEPTEGSLTIHGRVASLLEVGTGFHPELTGRENVFLNGAILGMTKHEIRRKFDEIVAFAEVEKFLDTPVKRFSSGMRVRLAFAVAAHLEPDILIIDEVLAVGDAAFQRKCLSRMNDVAREERTVILVSHNMLLIEDLASKVIWLHRGRMVEEGEAHGVTGRYLGTAFSPLNTRCWADGPGAPGNHQTRLHRARVRPTDGCPGDPLRVTRPFVLEFEFWNLKPEATLTAGIELYNEHGLLVFESAPVAETGWLEKPLPVGLFRFTCHVPANLLNSGLYQVTFNVVNATHGEVVHREEDILVFDAADSMEQRGEWYGSWRGVVRPILKWETDYLIAEGTAAPAGRENGVAALPASAGVVTEKAGANGRS